mgnify:CR=1 FL=1
MSSRFRGFLPVVVNVETGGLNSATDALSRLEDLAMEVVASPPKRLIAATVDLVVFISRTERGRAIQNIVRVTGANADGYVIEKMEH